MQWTIPGTVLSIRRSEADRIAEQFANLFLGGGVVRSQVSNLTGLEPHTVQNWVKRGFVAPPKGKRYSLSQLCRIITINALKNALPMERICSLLSYVNGQLDDESDDSIDDAQLYFSFVRLAARWDASQEEAVLIQRIRESLADYEEPVPGARERVEQVLMVMILAWQSAQLQEKAAKMLNQIGEME